MSRSLAGVNIEEDYKIENIEHQWNKLITSHQERDHAISEEISRLEKLHRLAEKLLRDIKQCDTNLDDLERKIAEEEKRVQRLNPLDAKFNIDQFEAELKQEEERIKGMFKDVQTLRDGRYHKATELHNRVQQLHQRWSNLKLDFQTKVVQVLADRRAQALKKPLTEEELIKSNPSFKFLHDCIQWVAERLKKLEELDYGHDLQSVKALIDQYKSEHRTIEQFQGKVDQCDSKRNQFQGEEYEIYVRMLNRLHKSYSELLVLSNKRLSDLDTLLDFVQAATNELKWLSEKEEIEINRDWSSKSINIVELEQHHRQLIVDLERREHQFNSVQDRGESLIRQRHPATKCIEGLMAKMQSQWSWLLQLISCLEDHLKLTGDNHQFYNESRECDQWLSRTEEKLNTTYSKQNFSIEEGEHLLKEMNNLKDDITKFGQIVSQLVTKSKDVYSLKQRKAPLPRPIKVRALCMVKQGTSTITKSEQVTLHDNSQKAKWRVTTPSGAELNVPGVCFVIPPPDQESIDTANDLKKKYETLVALWARKHHKLRQNMIFATLKIVKGWDYKTYCSMDPNQRNAIIKALEDDIDKIVREGPRDDPGSRRLQEEMDALKKKFAEFDARMRAEQDEKLKLQEKRAAIMEKFRLCEDGIKDLNAWLSDLEQRLANLGPVRERDEEVRKQISIVEEIIRDLESHQRQVVTTLDYSHVIAQQGSDFLNHEDISRVQKSAEALRRRYDLACDHSERLLRRLGASFEELKKFRTEFTTFSTWLNNAQRTLNDKEKAVKAFKDQSDTFREFTNDVIAHQADLRFISIALQRFIDETKDYLSSLNEFRSSLPRRLNNVESSESPFKSEVQQASDEYYKLLDRVNALNDRLAGLSDKQRNFADSYDRANRWLSDTKKNVKRVMEEKVEAEPRAIQDHLDRVKSLSIEVSSGGRLIDNVKQSGRVLVESMEQLGVSPSEIKAIEDKIRQLESDYNNLKNSLNDKTGQLQKALAEAQDAQERERNRLLQTGRFQDALSAFEKWLSEAEEMVANQKPPSADYNVVKSQLQEQKFLKKLLLDRQNSMTSLANMGKELMKNLDYSERSQVERQLNDIIRRFDTLSTGCDERLAILERTLPVARAFAEKIGPLQDWLENSERKLSSMMTIPTDQDRIRKRIAEHRILHQDIIAHKRDFEELTEIAQNLMSLVGDDEAQIVVDRLQEVTDRYAKLVEDSVALGQRLNESHEEIATFVLGFEDLLAWIDEMNSRLNRFKVLSIFVDKLREQLDELTEISEEIVAHRKKISDVVNSGQEIMKHASGDDSTFIKSKLDQLQVKFSELTHKASDKLRQAQDALPIAEKFHSAHNKLNAWMDDAERVLKQMDSLSLNQQESTIQRLESQVPENRTLLETINNLGPQLGHISPGQGAATVEGFVMKATRRFDAICSQIQRKAERIELTKQRNNEVLGDIDELFDWFRDAERQLLEAEPITPNPEHLAILLKETKSLNDDINSQKGRVRDILTNAKKVMRDSSSDDLANIRAKADDLKELANHVSQLCHDRLSALEQALPLAEHFFEAHAELSQWLDEAENEVRMLGKPAINASQIIKQQQIIKALIQSVADHKPLLDKLNKTGAALLKLIPEDEGRKIRQIIDSDNNRYNALRNILREQQNALEAALQATSQFVDKLDGMLNALNNTADQLKNAEPIAAHPERIQEQIQDNNAILNDLEKRADALEAVRHAAKDVILKAGKSDEPAIRDIKNKLNKLNDLWDHVQKTAKGRGKSLDDALKVAKRFWDELDNVMKAIKDIQDNLNNQEPPASEPTAIQQQQDTLQDIKQDIDHTKPEVDHVKKTGKHLLELCGEPDKPEVKKNIDDLDNAWDNVTSLFAKREKNLIDAMDKAMNFHETLQNLLEFLDYAEDKLANMGPIAADIEAIKGQIKDLKNFKAEVDPHMVDVEALNRQAHELLESVSPNQARAIREPLNEINRRWDDLLKGIVDRHSELENALLKLGQFQHALNEFLAWIQKTERTLDEMRPVFGDPQVIEVELAKHKVLMNDIQAHQTIVDTLNRAGKQLMDSERGTENARATQRKLNDLNSRWQALQDKANQRQKELEDALKEAQAFNHEIQDLLMWLNDVDGQLAASKPVGGLPETAREQLNRFMELYNELETNRPKVENVLKQGQDYLKRSTEGAATNLQHNLKTLKQRWENVLSRANDRKIKLEIALREATEFHEALQAFVDWLTSSEKYLSNLQPVSRVLDRVLKQIEEHKQFQKDISDHRETMLNLDKKGTHLKYFSQKQDVILIKNLLVSVQHRWEKVVSKAAERTRALDHGHKEAKEFQDAWSDLISWLDDAEKTFASLQQAGNEPDRIKQLLSRHKEFQRALGAKQATYDSTMKLGRALKEKAPKPDHSILQDMLDELKNKWNSICNKSVDRQRKLEEALLYSGQFKDAVQALIDWLDKAKQQLAIDKPVHGDLDTVTALVDQHKGFQEDFKSRAKNLSSVRKTASELLQTANHEDAQHIKEQISILNSKWDEVERLSEQKQRKLEDALRQAEQLHKAVHMLLEWLSDAEMKLRFAGPLPEDEATTRQHIAEHERFMSEMKLQEKNKDSTISLAKEILEKCHPDAIPVIRHWITIIQSRWEEVSAWAKQREQRLQDHLRSLRDIMELLEELLAWLIGAEASLLAAEAEPLPDDIITLENLIDEHQRFIDDMNRKEPDVDRVIKAFSSKRQPTAQSQPAKGREYDSRRRGVPPRTSTPIRGVEPEIKHPRARELMEKWRIVWKLAMERMKRLQDKLNYNRELDRMRNFDFDEWRRRFLAWMNNKKARIMDFFRKLDKDNDGKVTKADFIDGFLASKFPTSRLEMEKVADVFDRNNDGYIDHKEWVDTLRPDRDGQPKTESEIIQDEVQRQVAKCTCLVRYKVFQVGEGKYRFGESQKLRLVRILRSTVMVRVGGGWVSLDEFLIKNDPCRAKGRTNVELREQFILAEGVSQSMTPFKSKSPYKADGSIQTTGPITKIREKSERSVPMTHQHHYRNQTSDYSFSDQADTSGVKSRPRSRLNVGSNGSRPNSRPGSRQSSRPPSRAGSDLSTESLEDYQQRKVTSTSTRKYGLSSVKRTPSIGRTTTTAANGSATRDRWK